MKEIALKGVRVTLSQPRQVSEAVGYYWFPSLAAFPKGDLLLSAFMSADTNTNLVDAFRNWISTDKGKTWSRPFETASFGGGCLQRIAQSDGSIGGPQFYVYPDPPGQWRTLVGHFETFAPGGRRYSVEPYGVRIEGLPRDVHPISPAGTWGRELWPAHLVFYGHAVEVDAGHVTATYVKFEGDDKFSEVALRTEDRGRTWRYLSTVATHPDVPGAKEGPNEANVVRLENGDLMCVMRVGSREENPLARSYSADSGKTWSKPDRLPAFSVAPCLRRLRNGVIALTTGRPGIFLWLSTDARGTRWQSVDLLAHHNETLDAPHQIKAGGGHLDQTNPDQTTAYTEIVEIAPNRLLLAYDRIAFGWRPVPTDSSERNRIYVLEIDVEVV